MKEVANKLKDAYEQSKSANAWDEFERAENKCADFALKNANSIFFG
jgi:hypothetical protein